MKRFELFEYDKETERLREAKKVLSPSGILKDVKYPDPNAVKGVALKKREAHIALGKSAVSGNIKSLIDYIVKNKNVPILVTTVTRNKQNKKKVVYASPKEETIFVKIINHSQVVKELERVARAADPVLGDGSRDSAVGMLEKISIKVSFTGAKFQNKASQKDTYKIIVPLDSTKIKKSTGLPIPDRTRVVSIYDIPDDVLKKVSSYKGDKSGGGGNKYNQALQCVVSAALEHGITADDYVKEIPKYVDLGGLSLAEVLKTAENSWMRSAVVTHRAIRSAVGRKLDTHKFYEESSSFSSDIDNIAKGLFKEVLVDGKSVAFDRDRWNPADIWIAHTGFSPSELESETIHDMHDKMVKLFDNGRLIGVSLKKASGTGGVAKVKVRNHPKDERGIVHYSFDGTMNVKTSSDNPFPIKGNPIWPSEQKSSSKIKMDTYGATSGRGGKTRSSAIVFSWFTGSGGYSDGQIMGKKIVKICKPFFSYPDPKTLDQQFLEGYPKGPQSAFWKKFAELYNSVNGHPSMSARELRKLCYLRHPYDDAPKYKNPYHPYRGEGPKGHGPAVMWNNLHFLVPFQKLGKKRRSKLLMDIYMACTSTVLSSVVLVAGDTGYQPIIVTGPGAGQNVEESTLRSFEEFLDA